MSSTSNEQGVERFTVRVCPSCGFVTTDPVPRCPLYLRHPLATAKLAATEAIPVAALEALASDWEERAQEAIDAEPITPMWRRYARLRMPCVPCSTPIDKESHDHRKRNIRRQDCPGQAGPTRAVPRQLAVHLPALARAQAAWVNTDREGGADG